MKQAADSKSESGQGELLGQIDINTAIDYFGIMELLDNIGFFTIENYLMACREDQLD